MQLTPCAECHRHVAITERACPFCGGALEAARTPSKLGRVSRAVLFAGAAIATAACGKKTKQPDTKTNQQQVTPADAAVEEPVRNPAMPYGAPPARKRYV